MNEKKRNLIQAGMKLFASKGYHRTSVQEITSEAGVSKGAFYLYFQSKEEFIAVAYQYFYSQMKEKMEQVRQENLKPRESFAIQIANWFQYVYEHRDFLIMHLEEQITIAGSLEKLATEIKVDNYHWLRGNIENLYGASQIQPFLMDAVIQMDGMLHSYLKWMIFEGVEFDFKKGGKFLVQRLDNLVTGMMEKESALFSPNQVPTIYVHTKDSDAKKLNGLLVELKEKIQSMNLPASKMNELQEVMQVIEGELAKDECQPVVLKGLFAHYNQFPEVQKECQELAKLLKITLLP